MSENNNEVLYYTADEALQKAASVGIKVTLATLLAWVQKHKLGFQPGSCGSKWYVNREQFDNFIHGKLERTRDEVLYYTADEALQKAASVGIKVTRTALLAWVEKYKLGLQSGSRGRRGSKWYVNREQFDNFIHGKLGEDNGENHNE